MASVDKKYRLFFKFWVANVAIARKLAGIPGSPAAIYHFLMDAAGEQAVQSCRVQSEGVKNESKGLQETGLPATRKPASPAAIAIF